MNDFDKQKQEIIDEATKIIKGFGVGILDGLDNIVKKTMQLQPPAMPTCSTCDYRKEKSFYSECHNEKSELYTRHADDEWIKSVSCTFHSALE